MNEQNLTVLETLTKPMETPIMCREMYVSKAIQAFMLQADSIIYQNNT